ncbi:hypothetical protein GOZ83_19655 [Agrobacterium vitis]|uniref:hypothetical protein n=1 Tax=Agrobacterium vitis TaxID=373 RepID=UPI0012E8063A|nr:hypothetical protein [Agrobacterium vitis]MVA47274.1 hypothetical protein [Agrobacterium vitis]
MTALHVAKLTKQEKCPCCGAMRIRALTIGPHYEALYACGACFLAVGSADGVIESYLACRNVTAVAAMMLNREIEEEDAERPNRGI